MKTTTRSSHETLAAREILDRWPLGPVAANVRRSACALEARL